MFELKEGRFYRDRRRDVHGPLKFLGEDKFHCFCLSGDVTLTWTKRGSYYSEDLPDGRDLIEEVNADGSLIEKESEMTDNSPLDQLIKKVTKYEYAGSLYGTIKEAKDARNCENLAASLEEFFRERWLEIHSNPKNMSGSIAEAVAKDWPEFKQAAEKGLGCQIIQKY